MKKTAILALIVGIGLCGQLMAEIIDYKSEVKEGGEVVLKRTEAQGVYKILVEIPQNKLSEYRSGLVEDLKTAQAKVASLQLGIASVDEALALIPENPK